MVALPQQRPHHLHTGQAPPPRTYPLADIGEHDLDVFRGEALHLTADLVAVHNQLGIAVHADDGPELLRHVRVDTATQTTICVHVFWRDGRPVREHSWHDDTAPSQVAQVLLRGYRQKEINHIPDDAAKR